MLNSGWWFFALIIVVMLIAPIVWWYVPEWQLRQLRSRFKAEIAAGDIKQSEIEKLGDAYRKTVTQGLGGITLLIGAIVAFLQLQETKTATTNANLTLLFSKGFDLLSERNSVPQKIGGINALQAWAGANPEMYPLSSWLC